MPENDLESHPGGKFLKWALSWGKKIIILTELIVVLAFLSRFWLDSEVANNSDEIDRRKTIIEASSDFEKDFRTVSASINQIKMINSLSSPVTIYDASKSLIGTKVTISAIDIKGKKVSIHGTGADSDLSSLVSAFKDSNDFDNVTLEKVSKQSSSSTVDFSLTALYTRKTWHEQHQ